MKKESGKGRKKSSPKRGDKKEMGGQGLRDKRRLYVIAGALLIVVIISAFFMLRGGEIGPLRRSAPGMDVVRDIGVVKIRGDGLPGYDIDRDGRVDYHSKGFGYYRGLYDEGGFDYGPGGIELEEYGENLTLPALFFAPDEMALSGVGSVVIFSAKNETLGISSSVIFKTLGPALSTYSVVIDYADGDTYTIVDLISDSGNGTIEEREVEVAGRMIFRE